MQRSLFFFIILVIGVVGGGLLFFWQSRSGVAPHTFPTPDQTLSALQQDILYHDGTEVPFTSDLLHEKRPGTYYALDTRTPVFRSEDKFDSGTGWPSFTKSITPDAVKEISDTAFGLTRTAISSPAGGHLGHVFTDGPLPTGLRYCINGAVLYFVPDQP